MRIKLRDFLLILVTITGALTCSAQTFGIKTNLLSDAVLTPNLAIEAGVSPKWTVELGGSLNAWTVNDRKWKHWLVMPEARYWFCQRFSGHFIGAHVLGGQYNMGNLPLDFKFLGTDFSKLRDHRYQGWMAGAGIAYGYSWILDRHWNFEAEIGIGWIYSRSDMYNCADCGKKVGTDIPHNYVGPTKAALNIIYLF